MSGMSIIIKVNSILQRYMHQQKRLVMQKRRTREEEEINKNQKLEEESK